MNYRHFKYEGWLYWLAFLLALGLRFIGLGHLPLNDAEAQLALQSLRLADGLKPVLGPHSFYILFTTPLFFLYGGGTNFLARFIPAIVGSFLVFAPRLFDDRLKPRPSLILAFFIAIDPGLTAISKQAGSPILAITFLIFALGFFNKKNVRAAGIFAALALLGGPSIWAGLLSLGISWAIYQFIQLRLFAREESVVESPALSWKEALVPFLITFIVAGTLVFTIPNGLSAALLSIPAYIGGWGTRSDFQVSWMLLSLLAYQPFAVLLFLMATVRGWIKKSQRVIPLGIWFLVSLLLPVFYPARLITDLSWALLPLYAIAALEFARYIDVHPGERNEAMGAVLLTAFLWVFGWLNFAALVWSTPGVQGYTSHLWLVIGSLILLVLSLVLVAFGWSIRVSQLGMIWGLGLGLTVLSMSGNLGSGGIRSTVNPELWWGRGIPLQADLLVQTVDDVSEWGVGNDNALPVVIYGIQSPALEWALREHPLIVTDTLDISSSPALIVTSYQVDPTIAATYRGQDFTWRFTTNWELAQPQGWTKWFAYREMVQTGENIILWARDDLFINKK